MINRIRKFAAVEDGVTAVEYSVLAVLIITAIVAAMATFQPGLVTAFSGIAAKLVTPS